jgi:hypothetical protein
MHTYSQDLEKSNETESVKIMILYSQGCVNTLQNRLLQHAHQGFSTNSWSITLPSVIFHVTKMFIFQSSQSFKNGKELTVNDFYQAVKLSHLQILR